MSAGESTERFFDYWRRRAAFIEGLPLPDYHHEANVLLGAALDSLANLWGRAVQRPDGNQGRRFGDFVVQFSGPFSGTLERISLPYLRWRATEKRPKFSAGVLQALQTIGAPATHPDPYSEEARAARMIPSDPTARELLTKHIPDAAGAKTQAGVAIEDWVLDARFAEIAYREFRCSWVHEGRGGEASHSFTFSDDEPTYFGNGIALPPRIGFSVPYLLKVLRACIDGFEAMVQTSRIDPVPPPHLKPIELDDV